MHYFVKIDYQPELGLGAEELVRRIKEDRIPANALIRRADSSEWKPLESFPELVYTNPPPIPTETPDIEEDYEKSQINTKSSKTSILAILSLALSLFAFVGATFFSSMIGIVLGHISLRQIRLKSYLKGRPIAISGIIFGYLYFLIFLITIGFTVIPAITKASEKARDKISNQDSNQSNLSQKVIGRSLPYSFSVPASWSVKYNTSNFDSVAASDDAIVGVIVQDSEYESMSAFADEVIYKANLNNANNIDVSGPRNINGLHWTIVNHKIQKGEKVFNSKVYLLSQNGYSIRLAFTTVNSPFEEKASLFDEILSSFKIDKN